MSKLSKGERLILWAGVALLVLAVIPIWMSVESLGFSDTGNAMQGYGFFPVELALLCALVVVGLTVAKLAGAKLPVDSKVSFGLCAAAFVLLVIGVFTGPEGSELEGAGAALGVAVDLSRGIGLYLGAALGAVMAWGAWQEMQSPAATTPPPATTPPAA